MFFKSTTLRFLVIFYYFQLSIQKEKIGMYSKSIIIDFDHTIGYFEQIIFLINIIETVYQKPLSDDDTHQLLFHYPNIFRPKLFDIINYIIRLQKKKSITFFILYTCNNKESFVHTIVSFLEKKLNHCPLFQYKLFEKTKHKNANTITSHIENISSHEVCIIDNKVFDYKHSNYKYIKCEDYRFLYNPKEICKLFPYKHFGKVNATTLTDYLKYKRKKDRKHKILPYVLYDINSSFILQSIHEFVS